MTKKPITTGLTVLHGGSQPVPEIQPLASWIATADWLAHLSDTELATLLTEHLLLMTQIGTLPNDLLSEAIDRLEGRNPRDPRD